MIISLSHPPSFPCPPVWLLALTFMLILLPPFAVTPFHYFISASHFCCSLFATYQLFLWSNQVTTVIFHSSLAVSFHALTVTLSTRYKSHSSLVQSYMYIHFGTRARACTHYFHSHHISPWCAEFNIYNSDTLSVSSSAGVLFSYLRKISIGCACFLG